MGKFIKLLVPDYVYPANDNDSRMTRLLIGCCGLFLILAIFLKVVHSFTGGEVLENKYLWVPITLISLLISIVSYYFILIMAVIFVKYVCYNLIKYVLFLFSSKIKNRSRSTSYKAIPSVDQEDNSFSENFQISNVAQEADSSQPEERKDVNCFVNEIVDSQQEYSLGNIVEERDISLQNQTSSFRVLLNCNDVDGLIKCLNDMLDTNDDGMLIVTILMVLLYNGLISFKSMNVKKIHKCFCDEFGPIISYSQFNSLWSRAKNNDFTSEMLDEYDEDKKFFYTDEEKDLHKYYRVHRKLKESGYIS